MLKVVDQKKIKLNDDFDENDFGDKFIREARVSREQQNRLKYIDTQLDTMRSNSQAINQIYDNSTVSYIYKFRNNYKCISFNFLSKERVVPIFRL